MLLEEDEVNNYGYFIDIDLDLEYDYPKNDYNNSNFTHDFEESIIEYKDKPLETSYFNNKGNFFFHTLGFFSASVIFIELWILGNNN
jgi:hypothetical protein